MAHECCTCTTKFDESIDIAIGIDMSGSIGNKQGEDFLGEVQGIMDEYQTTTLKYGASILKYITNKTLVQMAEKTY